MKLRVLIAFLLCAFVAACGAARESTPAARGTVSTEPSPAANWMADDDANLAWPACPHCGAVAERGAVSCGNCGQAVHVEAKSIACPECHGDKDCQHCGVHEKCVMCNGSHQCGICDGTGKWHGEECPSCDGTKVCRDCVVGAKHEPCDRCADTHVCANCEGTGRIALR